jgi:hypothetical protein
MPVIDQVVIRHDTNEGGMFLEVFVVLETNYGALIRVYSMDAGFCSKANADLVAGAAKVYLFGLKGNQPELFKAAERRLGSLTSPEVSSDWESYQGARIRSHLYRTSEMAPLPQVEPPPAGLENRERDHQRPDRRGPAREPLLCHESAGRGVHAPADSVCGEVALGDREASATGRRM